MSISIKKRMALGAGAVATVGAVATLVAGVTFGLFSATSAPQTNTFTAGTVSLTSTATHTCNVGPLSPGDGTVSPGVVNNGANNGNGTEVQCVLDLSYTGNTPAYLGLNVAVKSTVAGADPNLVLTGAQGLYDGNQATSNLSDAGLQVLVKDNSGTIIGSAANAAGTHYGAAAAFDTNLAGPTTGNTTTVSDFLLSSTPYTQAGTHTDTITVDYYLPLGADNSYQGAASSITLTAHAVQSTNNPATGCSTNLVCSTLTWS